MNPKFKANFIATAILILMAAMTMQCAKIGTISGGDKDTTAPVLRRSTPDVGEAEYDGKKVKIKFDEYFQLDNVEQKFLLSPPHDSIKPKIKTKGKYLIVKFKEKLKPDTTYTLQFFDAVKDFNEGNKIPDFKFAFSTGATVDSFAVAGQVFDAETLEKEKEMLVGLYGEQTGFADSAFIKYKPDYITRTDTAGRFKIENIRPGRYKVVALKDINETQRFDLENEKIAYLKTPIETHAERYIRIDSLPAGTILHVGEKGKRRLDTLPNDTVIIQNILHTTPNNLKLYTFEEKHLVQYISERNRDLRTRINLVFNKPMGTDTVLVTHVEDTLSIPEILFDYNYTRDSLTLWLRDTADINNDTLKLRVTFATLDSLKNPTTETDTISVKFTSRKKVASKDKKSEKPKDTGIDSLQFRIKGNFSGDFDIQKKITISIPLPLQEIDTSMLRLYEIVDSSFNDDMNQKLVKSVRLDSANYRLVFKRPILGDIVWYPTFDSIVSPNWYTATYSTNRDTVNIQVTDSAMIHRSKFPNLLKYRYDYYLDQTVKARDSVSTVIINQKVVKYDRPSRDTIQIILDKPPTRGVEVSAINVEKLPENTFEIIQNNDRITIVLHDTAATHKDTLALKFNTFDRLVRNKNGKLIEKVYKDTLFAMYKIKYQRLRPAKLLGTDTIMFSFERALTSKPEISLIDHPERGSRWYRDSLTAKRDTFFVISNDNVFRQLDTIKYVITYPTLDRYENEIIQSDTLQLVRPKEKKEEAQTDRRRRSEIGKEGQKQKAEAEKGKFKATLRFPLQYEMSHDTLNNKNLVLSYPFEPGKQYMMEIDDSTFTSIYGTPNLYLTSKAKIRELDYYGQMTIDLQNIGYIENAPDIDEDIPPFENLDTSRTLHKRINPRDTMAVQHAQINEGQLLVCLCNAKGEIKYKQAIAADSVVKFEYILPAEYKVKIIHDRDANGKWDTGKYIEQSYPERTMEHPKKQIVKSKWVTELIWKL